MERRASRGRPTKDSEPPKTKVEWRIDVKMEFNETLAEELANEHDISVIVTGLPFADEDAENLRSWATTDTVLRLYLDQCKVEHTYRLMKSGMGVDTVYVQTPSRAMLLVVAIAILVLSIMDTMLRRNNERYRTVRRACNDLRDVTLETATTRMRSR